MSTKDYSSKHESMVANLLGWHVVSGSGARHTRPGDVESDTWMGECKTHVSDTGRISFLDSVWKKIVEEADSRIKYPVLFVDSGTQSQETTWCLVHSHPFFDMHYEDVPDFVRINANSISFDVSRMNRLLQEHRKSCETGIMYRFRYKRSVYCIVSLTDFAMLCGVDI